MATALDGQQQVTFAPEIDGVNNIARRQALNDHRWLLAVEHAVPDSFRRGVTLVAL